MNREQTIEAIKVMQAWVDGEAVESIGSDGMTWVELSPDSPTPWDFCCKQYRIKPKPIRKYVVIEHDGSAYTYESKLEADEAHDYSLAKWDGWMVEEAK